MMDILDQLNSEHTAERWHAVQEVFRHKNPPFSHELILRLMELLGDAHAGVRTYARKSLQKAGVSILPHLRDVVQSSPRPRQLAQIALLVGNLDGELLLFMTTDKRAVVKVAILQAMARQPDKRYLPYQLQSLDDPHGHVRYHAALGIARQGLTIAPDELIEALQSNSILARGAVMYALGKIGDPKAVDALVAALQIAVEDANVDPAVTAVAGQPMTPEEWRRFSAAHGPIDLPLMAVQALIWIGEAGTLHQLDIKENPKLRACVELISNQLENV